jgi:putative ABC transport system permease protein
MLHDLLAALRVLRRHRAFTILTVLSLGLAIGATVAVFSVVDAALLRPLPFREPEQLADLVQRTVATQRPDQRLSVPWTDIQDLRAETNVFEDVGARGLNAADVMVAVGDEPPQYAAALQVSYNYFSILGIHPFLGRTFVLGDAVPAVQSAEGGSEQVAPAVVVSYGFWQRALGGDSAVLHRTVRVWGSPIDVVGVLPRDLTLYNSYLNRWVNDREIDIYRAWPERVFASRGQRPGSRGVIPLARLRAGVTFGAANAELEVLAARLRTAYPGFAEEKMHYLLLPMEEIWRGEYRATLLVLTGGVLFLLLLVSANLANLLLVRGWARAGEDAVRSAVGCSRARLVRGRILESLLLAAGGGAVGIAFAWLMVRVLDAVAPGNIPVLHAVAMNTHVVLAGLAAAAFLVVLFAVIPAVQAGRVNPARVLASEGRGAAGRKVRRVMNGLVIAEIVLSMVLLCGAGVMMRSLLAMTTASHGFEGDKALTFDLTPYTDEFRGRERRAAFYTLADERLGALPGVEAVGRSSMVPFSGMHNNGTFAPDRERFARSGDWADFIVVSRDYFEAMGTRLLAGRRFTPAEMEDSTASIIVDAKLAGVAWPGQDPIGKTLFFDRDPAPAEGVVVGMVEHMLMQDFGAVSRPALFFPERGRAGSARSFAVRTALPPERVMASVRGVLQDMDPTLVPYKLQKLSDRVGLSAAPTRLVTLALSAFAALAILVAALGLFGVISYTVRTRTAEMGIRMALGAEKRDIMSMVLRQGALLSLAGIAGGIVGALVLERFLKSMIFGASAASPVVLAITAVTLSVVALLACWAPARWACRVDPVRALRAR